MKEFAKLFGAALLSVAAVVVFMTVLAMMCSTIAQAQEKSVFKWALKPVCHTEAQLKVVAGIKSRHKTWENATDLVNNVHPREVCMLQRVKYRREFLLATVSVGSERYELWQISLVAIHLNGEWRYLEKPATEYTLAPVTALASGTLIRPRPQSRGQTFLNFQAA